MSFPVVVLAGCALVYLLFLLWSGGRCRPMSAGEVDSLLERVQRNAQATGVPSDPDLLASLREVAVRDDGREFVMGQPMRIGPCSSGASGSDAQRRVSEIDHESHEGHESGGCRGGLDSWYSCHSW